MISWIYKNNSNSVLDYNIKLRNKFKAISKKEIPKVLDVIFSKDIDAILISELVCEENPINWGYSLSFNISDNIREKFVKNGYDKTLLSNSYGDKKNHEVILKGKSKSQEYTNTEKKIAEIWGNLLGIKEVNINDDFFNLGGNSILVTKLQVEMEENGINLEYSDFYEYPTLSRLSAIVDQNTDNKSSNILTNNEEEKALDSEEKNFYDKNCKAMQDDKCKQLDNFKAFNDIFYRNCFYNACFPIANHYGKSIVPFLINDIAVYDYGDNGNYINMDYLQCSDIENLLKLNGVIMDVKTSSKDIINDIITSIDNDKPVIILVDCFYESIRADAYMKNHWTHNILVYGYNNKSETFDVIEHKHRDNLSYEKRTLSYLDIANSYYSYITNFQQNIIYPTYYEFYAMHGENIRMDSYVCNIKQYKTIYSENLQEKKLSIIEGFKKLNSFIQSFKQKIFSNDISNENIGELVYYINNIINVKQVEKYKISKLFIEDGTIEEILDSIISSWTFIRVVLAKFTYTKKYKRESFLKIINKLESVYELEQQYIERILIILKNTN